MREGACTAVTATYATTQPTYARDVYILDAPEHFTMKQETAGQ